MNNSSLNNPYLVKKYTDDDGNWYRLYSDGWLEQGGKTDAVYSLLINFLLPFKDMPSIATSAIETYGDKTCYTATSSISSTAFSIISGMWDTNGALVGARPVSKIWFACGYVSGGEGNV